MNALVSPNLAYGFFDSDVASAFGSELRGAYQAARPFPHIILDDLFSSNLLDQCIVQFPAEGEERAFARSQERLKSAWNPDSLNAPLRSLFYSFNSRPFLKFLEKLTGIEGLIPDPYFLGGGLHQTSNGGKLDMHIDFNFHKKLGLERRINVLVYLNRDWREEYGGCLELWNPDVTRCEQKIVPIFNRTVVFSTTEKSWHGHPEPVNHPRAIPRRSIALYYYTATWDAQMRNHTTHFRPRPNTSDKVDYTTLVYEFAKDWLLPPGFVRVAKRARKKMD